MSSLLQSSVYQQKIWGLDQWLEYLQQLHPKNIELGLDRVNKVFKFLKIDMDEKTVVTVAGTNGKGTTCALIEQALLTANQTVAVFSSPHLIDYRERVRVAGNMLSASAHCQAFMQVERARQEVSLTYFEFATLAALVLLAESNADYLLLEVGLGGRLDAVNIVDPNVAVITGIALDHQDWLGNTRELIAIEKAGILRPNIPVVIGEPNPPVTLNEAAQAVAVKPLWQGVNFRYQIDNTGFNWQGMNHQYRALPVPHIPAQNASTALQVLEILGVELEHQQMVQVFSNTQLLGRRQIIQHQPTVMLDVAHNPQATALLANDLKSKRYRSVIAVVGMLTDKDIKASLAPMLSVISTWHCATLNVPRGASANTLFSILSAEKKVLNFNSVETAFLAALEKSAKDDLIIVFGSFFTVADVLKVRSLDNQKEVE